VRRDLRQQKVLVRELMTNNRDLNSKVEARQDKAHRDAEALIERSIERLSALRQHKAAPATADDTFEQRAEALVAAVVPPGATIAVISKGDPRLVSFPKCPARHFPCEEDGEYAGYHPANGQDAIAMLEQERARGVEFLLIPWSALWWLRHYPDFTDHLRERHNIIVRTDEALVADLRTPVGLRPASDVAAGPARHRPPEDGPDPIDAGSTPSATSMDSGLLGLLQRLLLVGVAAYGRRRGRS
jgi:hypothetical protein